jgi:capsular polysaccharide transport system permease protein
MSGAAQGIGLFGAMRIQAQVIGALVIREMHTRYGRENIGYVWLFIEPMILAAAIGLLHSLSGHGLPGGLPTFAFYVVGYTPFYLLRAVLNRAAGSVVQNAPLFYHSRVTVTDVVVARSLLEGAAVMVAMAVFITGIGIVTGEWPHDWVLMALGVVSLLALCHGAALIILSLTVLGEQNVERIVHPYTYLSIPMSGAFVMVWWLPYELHWWATIYPTVHSFEMTRAGYFGPVVPYHYDVPYLLASIVILNVLGLLALRVARPHLEA